MKKKFQKLVEPHKLHSKLGDTFEFVGDLFIVFLIILLFYLGFLALVDIGHDLIAGKTPFEELLAKFIYIFILTELFRLMIIYLRERRVDIPTVIKTTLIAILREVIIKAPHYKFLDFIGISLLLLHAINKKQGGFDSGLKKLGIHLLYIKKKKAVKKAIRKKLEL